MERGAFMCLCPPRYNGKTCESGKQVRVCVTLLLEPALMGSVAFLNRVLFRGGGVSL